MLILERPWTQQPQGTVDIADRWRGRVLTAVLPSVQADMVGKRPMAGIGTPPGLTVDSIGRAYSTSTAGAYQVASPTIPNSVVGCALVFSGSFPVNIGSLVSFGEVASGGGFFHLSFSGGVMTCVFRGRAGGSTTARNTSIGGAITRTTLVGIITAANSISVYQDGVNVSAGQSSSIGVDNLLWSTFAVGALVRDTATYAGAGAAVAFAGAVQRCTVAEAISLSANPWQLFSPQQIYIPTATAAGYTHPTLSAATATEIGATSFKPRVTYEFV